jgi:fusion protein PurCD
MNVLILGSGGREHTIGLKLIKSNCILYTNGNNYGLNKIAKKITNKYVSNEELVKISKEIGINMVVIGPETYLADGIVDKFEDVGIPCIGPNKNCSLIETSKTFTRRLLNDNNLAKYNPKYKIFYPGDKGYKEFIEELNYEYVIKPDGLHGGECDQYCNGVKLSGEDIRDVFEASKYCEDIYKNYESFIIEEKLKGEEFSLMSFTDGITLKHMIPVKDYKRLGEGDTGPNTSSMGSITMKGGLWFLNNDDINTCQYINETVVHLLSERYGKYKGIIYGSFIKTQNGDIKVIEFNARFGLWAIISNLSLLL